MSKLVDHDSNDTSLFISPAVPSDPSVNQNEFPEGGLASWLVISGAFSLLTASWGMLSVGIFQAHFAANQLRDFTDSQIGWIPGVFVFVSLALGIPVGVLFDRYGSTPLLVFGSICYVARFVALAQCYLYWHFMLCFGVLTGIGAAFMSTTSLSVVPQYFQRRAGLAMGCALSGSGLGGTIFPFALRAGFDNLGWAWTNRLMGLVFGIMCALGICLVKSRLPTREVTRSLNLECFKESRFTLLVIGLFFVELVLFSLVGILPTFVSAVGFSSANGTGLISTFNACTIFGCFTNGHIADRFGRLNSLLWVLGLSTLVIFAIWVPFGHSLPGIYIFSALFGVLSGAYTNVSPTCIAQISTPEEMGARLGACYSVVSFGCLISVPLSGELLLVVGPQNLIIILGALMVIPLIFCNIARWACLGYRWCWREKV